MCAPSLCPMQSWDDALYGYILAWLLQLLLPFAVFSMTRATKKVFGTIYEWMIGWLLYRALQYFSPHRLVSLLIWAFLSSPFVEPSCIGSFEREWSRIRSLSDKIHRVLSRLSNHNFHCKAQVRTLGRPLWFTSWDWTSLSQGRWPIAQTRLEWSVGWSMWGSMMQCQCESWSKRSWNRA